MSVIVTTNPSRHQRLGHLLYPSLHLDPGRAQQVAASNDADGAHTVLVAMPRGWQVLGEHEGELVVGPSEQASVAPKDAPPRSRRQRGKP